MNIFYLSILLLLFGVVFLSIEAFIPGFGIFGISGLLMVSASILMTLFGIEFGFIIVLIEVVILTLLMYLVIKIAKRKQIHSKLVLRETSDIESKEVGGLDYFVGKEGIAKTPLKPYGSADFNGVIIDVCSDGQFIKKDIKIKVVDVVSNRIIVKPKEDASS